MDVKLQLEPAIGNFYYNLAERFLAHTTNERHNSLRKENAQMEASQILKQLWKPGINLTEPKQNREFPEINKVIKANAEATKLKKYKIETSTKESSNVSSNWKQTSRNLTQM